VTRHHSCRVSPFGHPRIHARLTAPRGISQPPTSFIGSQCQGIHHAPLNTYTQNRSFNSRKNQRNCITTHHTTHPQPGPGDPLRDARNHYPQIKHHTPPPKTRRQQPTPLPGALPPVPHTRGEEAAGLVVSKPNSVSDDFSRAGFPPGTTCLLCTRATPTTGVAHPLASLEVTEPPHAVGGPQVSWCSLERR
jgi:hypothetical protein